MSIESQVDCLNRNLTRLETSLVQVLKPYEAGPEEAPTEEDYRVCPLENRLLGIDAHLKELVCKVDVLINRLAV